MDSDSSLDGEFESKHEVAARRNSAATQSESDSEENDESDLSSTDSEDEQDGPAVPSRRESSHPTPNGDGSDSDGGKQSQIPANRTPQLRSLDRDNWLQSLNGGGLPGTVVGNRSPGSDQRKLSPGSNSSRHSSSENGKLSPNSQYGKHNPASVHGKHSLSSEDEEDIHSSEDEQCSPNSEDGNHSPTSEDGKHSPTSEYGNHSPTSEDGKHSPFSEDGEHSPTSEDRKCSPTSEYGKRSPTSEDGKHFPSFEDKHFPTSEEGKCFPTSEEGKSFPTSEEGKSFPTCEEGKSFPTCEEGKSFPTSEEGKSFPTSEEGKRFPTSEEGKHSSSLKGGKRSPGSEGGKHSPGSEGGKHSPGSEGGKRSLSSKGGKRSPGSEGGRPSPSSEGGKPSASSEGGKPSASSEGGKPSPSSEGGKHSASSEGGEHSPSSEGGKHSPSSGIGKRSTRLRAGKSSTGSGVGKRSSGSGVGKRPSGSGVGKRSSGSGVRKHTSGSDVGKHTSASGVGKRSSGSGVVKHSSGSDVGKHSSSSGVRKRSSSSGVGKRSSGSVAEKRSPHSSVGKRSPGSGVRKNSPSLGTGKHSPSLHIGTYFKVGEHPPSLSPRSPSFRDELCVRSPDPGKCTPSLDHENQSPSFYGRVHSPGDKSPSTDFGKQSPGSGHGRWTPSPDRSMRSPKLRGSELGEESVGSCSGIQSPSLNGDTRSSRAWSPSPERDKHFRVASQEVQSAVVDVAAVNLPIHKNDANSEEMVSRLESAVLVPNRDSECHSPKLSSKEPSPKSNLSELSAFLGHKKDSVKSSRSRSLDVCERKASSKTNKKTSVAGHVSPTSNDGELSDSSQDISSKLKKLSTRASGGETVKERIQTNGEIDKTVKKSNITSHGEDLSDVSDLEINDGAESLGEVLEDHDKKTLKGTHPIEEVEQLDFEAEEREEGECEAREDGKSDDEGELKGDELEEGELTDDDEYRPEETEPRPICRFYSRGQCTWGPNCRFLHPGVTDKGNYTMFDTVRPLVTINGPPIYPMEYRVPVPVPVPYEKPAPAAPYQGPRKEEPPVFESAWERGLRQAKEMMRKSTKRKEMDMDFEEKKMNLSLGQEELDKENDYYTRQASPTVKEESDRWSSYDRLKAPEPDGKYVREGSVFEEFPSDHPYYHQHSRGEYWRRVQYEPGGSDPRSSSRLDSSDYRSSSKYRRSPSDHYYDKYDKKKKSSSSHSTREVIMQRVDKPWRDERYAEVSTASSHRGRGDEWADPWMRSKSPTGRKGTASRPTRKSYSSGSSYSSSSSSRSSSRSSYSSYSRDSHSRSRSKSFSRSRSRSRSRSPAARRRKPNRPLVPTARAAMAAGEASLPSLRVGKLVPELRTLTKAKPTVATLLTASEKKAVTERALLMNPPAPTPRKTKDARPPSPGMMRKVAQNPPAPSANASKGVSGLKTTLDRPKLTVAGAASIKAKMRSHSASSRSSSGSDSSGSSSDSSESSYSSSSSSREPSPKALRPQKRMVIDERERLAFAQSMKIKAMDALKLSGQKQQIKLTLKTPASLGGSAVGGATTVKKPGTGLPELPELNLVRRERGIATLAGKKRPAEDTAVADQAVAAKMAALSKPAMKKATSRREELLKQLKAVEDAIARKRSKIIP